MLTEDPTLLLYTLMANHEQLQTPFNASFLQQRLNSENKLERYIGLVCIGCLCEQATIAPLLVVVPMLAASEMISDVRDLAVAITTHEQQPAIVRMNTHSQSTKSAMLDHVTKLKNKLVSEERKRLKNNKIHRKFAFKNGSA